MLFKFLLYVDSIFLILYFIKVNKNSNKGISMERKSISVSVFWRSRIKRIYNIYKYIKYRDLY